MRSISLLVYKAVDGTIEVGCVCQRLPCRFCRTTTGCRVYHGRERIHGPFVAVWPTPRPDVSQEIARDYHANWMTAVEMLNDDVYIGGESDCNIFTLRRNAGKLVFGRFPFAPHMSQYCRSIPLFEGRWIAETETVQCLCPSRGIRTVFP